jgi:hypothetical protein
MGVICLKKRKNFKKEKNLHRGFVKMLCEIWMASVPFLLLLCA